MKQDTKTIYAQSSDIKARTYLEYRKDMKQKSEGVTFLYKRLKQFSKPNGSFQSSKIISPLDDTKYALFTINILEDLTQDILFYYGPQPALKPIKKIYQTVPFVEKTFEFIQEEKRGKQKA